MSNVSDKLRCVQFADDTTLFLQGRNIRYCAEVINAELKKFNVWLCANKLSINFKKTYYMLFSNCTGTQNISIKLRGKQIERVDYVKFLGVYVGDKLNFSFHVRHVNRKMSGACGIIRKLAQFIPAHALRKIYLSIAYPYMMYGVELWGKSSATQLAKLSRLQSKCIGIIHPNQSVFLSCQLYHLLSFEKIYTYYVLIKFYQYYITKHSLLF